MLSAQRRQLLGIWLYGPIQTAQNSVMVVRLLLGRREQPALPALQVQRERLAVPAEPDPLAQRGLRAQLGPLERQGRLAPLEQLGQRALPAPQVPQVPLERLVHQGALIC